MRPTLKGAGQCPAPSLIAYLGSEPPGERADARVRAVLLVLFRLLVVLLVLLELLVVVGLAGVAGVVVQGGGGGADARRVEGSADVVGPGIHQVLGLVLAVKGRVVEGRVAGHPAALGAESEVDADVAVVEGGVVQHLVLPAAGGGSP